MQGVCSVKPRRVRGKEEVPYLVAAEKPNEHVNVNAQPYDVDKVSVDVVGTFLNVRETNGSSTSSRRCSSTPKTMFANDRTEAKSYACRFVNRSPSTTSTPAVTPAVTPAASPTAATEAKLPEADASLDIVSEKISTWAVIEAVSLEAPEDAREATKTTVGFARAA